MKKEFVKAEVKVIKYEFSDVIVTSPNTPPDGFTTKTAHYSTNRNVWYTDAATNLIFHQIINTEFYFGPAGAIRHGAYADFFNEYNGNPDDIPGISACK